MIHSLGYRSLVDHKATLVGKSVIDGDFAMVLVTVLNSDESASVFRFYLSRQSAPYAGCWMTDAVTPDVPQGPSLSGSEEDRPVS
jgi:hypothetical protein